MDISKYQLSVMCVLIIFIFSQQLPPEFIQTHLLLICQNKELHQNQQLCAKLYIYLISMGLYFFCSKKTYWDDFLRTLVLVYNTKFILLNYFSFKLSFCDGCDLIYCVFLIVYFVSSSRVSQVKLCGARRRGCHHSGQLSIKGKKVPRQKYMAGQSMPREQGTYNQA